MAQKKFWNIQSTQYIFYKQWKEMLIGQCIDQTGTLENYNSEFKD